LSHLVSLTVTMSPKSSLPQPAKSVSVALTPDTLLNPLSSFGRIALQNFLGRDGTRAP
jgi:hypothetical protein